MTEMSVSRLNECLQAVVFSSRNVDDVPSNATVARRIGWPIQEVAAWRTGYKPVPPAVAAWLERRTAARLADPIPVLASHRQMPIRNRTLPTETEAKARSMLLRSSMDALGWKNLRLASKIGRSEESVRRFLQGKPEQAAPLDLLSWLERVRVEGEDRAGPPPALTPPPTDAALNAPQYAQRLRAAMDALGMGIAYLSKSVNRTFEGVRQWTLGKVPVPGELLAWLERMAASYAADPPPPYKSVQTTPSIMTVGRLAEILNGLQISSRELSARVPYLSIDGKDVRRWRGGNRPVPPDVADWLERVWAARHDEDALGEVWTNPPSKGEDFWSGEEPPMHPEELDHVMQALSFSPKFLQAAVSWLEEGEVDGWLAGVYPVESNVARWLRALHKANGDDIQTGWLMRRRPPTPLPGLERLSDRQNVQINGDSSPQEENEVDPKRPMTLDEIL